MKIAGTTAGLEALARPRANSTQEATDTPSHRKLVKAAQEFEGILISQLLGDFKEPTGGLGGDSSMSGTDTLNSLAIQSLSEALARRGGLGIGSLLVHQLEPSLGHGQPAASGGKD